MYVNLPQLNCLLDLFNETPTLHLDVERAQMLLGSCSVWNIAKNAEGNFPHDNDVAGEMSLGFRSNKNENALVCRYTRLRRLSVTDGWKEFLFCPENYLTYTHTHILQGCRRVFSVKITKI